MSTTKYQKIKVAANNIRKHVLKLTLEKNGCYLSQACSSAEILASLYLEILNITKSQVTTEIPLFPGTDNINDKNYPQGAYYNGKLLGQYDRLFISPAHYAAPVYAALVEAGRLSIKALDKFNVDGYALEMIGANHTPGFETAAGTLAQAISVAGGTAHSRKLKKQTGRIFVFMSDGELQEGQVWEAIQALSFYKLDNLILLIDINGQQVEGATKDIMNIEPIAAKFSAFGAKVISIDGNNIEQIVAAVKLTEVGKPLVILCYTSPTYGIPLLESRRPYLHFIRFTDEKEFKQYKKLYSTM